MLHIERILFPTDFSAPARRAEEQACIQARSLGAELHLLYVAIDASAVHPHSRADYLMPVAMADAVESAKTELSQHPEPQWAEGLRIVRAVREGDPAGMIIRYAGEHNVGMIILGTHGRTGLMHLLLGSTAEYVMRHATCPVMVVPSRQ